MEIINKDDGRSGGENGTMNKELFQAVEKGKLLKELLKGYFSMVEHLEDVDYLVNNIDYYYETLSKLITFSKTPFMEKTIWRVSDNGKFKEYCGAHLRNLLSPFKNMIGLINGFSEGKVNTELLRSFKDKLNLDNNEKEFLEFCDFLEKK